MLCTGNLLYTYSKQLFIGLVLCMCLIYSAASTPDEQTFGLCQGQKGFIQCSDGYRIKIISAIYGRTSKEVCPAGKSGGGKCRAHSSDIKVKWNCNGYNICHLHANKASFGDPCPRQSKYLMVKYKCVKSAEDCRKGFSETIAFSAFISKDWKVARDTFLNVVYDKTYFNIGGAYNTHTGFFTAPSDGLYIFSWTSYVNARKIFESAIRLNGHLIGISICHNEAGNATGNCSNTTPLLLKKGDKVHIHKRHGNHLAGHWSSFKGWKVY